MISFKRLREYKNRIVHGVLERKDGPVNPRINPQSVKNILRALKNLGSKQKPGDLIFAQQLHSPEVYSCPPDMKGCIKEGVDGLISHDSSHVLVIRTADCLPILIYDRCQNQVGALHAGREGLISGIIENGIGAFGSNPSCLIVGIGPHIRKCCYFLRGQSLMYAKEPYLRRYIEKRQDNLYFDLSQITEDRLLSLGVLKENIEDCKICTFCQAQRFFSARKREEEPDFYKKKEGDIPCFGSFIGLKEHI